MLRLPAQLYTTLIRGVPDLVLMLLIFYSLQTWLTGLTGWPVPGWVASSPMATVMAETRTTIPARMAKRDAG